MKISTHWLRDYVKIPSSLEKVAERLTMAGLEVERIHPCQGNQDSVFEIEVTTNRPDWLSHLGVAREIAAIEDLAFKMPPLQKGKGAQSAGYWKVRIQDSKGCPYYTGVLIEGIACHETPDFMKQRLEACGLRSISLIVDITNYVLLETGQPLHAFDADRIQGKLIQIRGAQRGEKLTAIDGSPLALAPEDLVIADESQVLALAGVMGGRGSEVSAQTKNVFLESAFFQPARVRKTSQRYGLASESSYRFERRVDPEGVDLGRDRALWLICQYAKPRAMSRILRAGKKPVTFAGPIFLRSDEIRKVLGFSIPNREVPAILKGLGFHVARVSTKGWRVKIPSFRADLTRSIDLIEEIARIYGYENIPETLPERKPLWHARNPRQDLEELARGYLSGAGFYETVSFSLISGKGLDENRDLKGALRVVNPQNKELCWMRPSLFPSLMDVIQWNFHWGSQDVFVFEIANVYRMPGQGSTREEERYLSLALSGDWQVKSWMDQARVGVFYDLKGVVQGFLERSGISEVSFLSKSVMPHINPEVSETIMLGEESLGYLGELDERIAKLWDLETKVYLAEISLDKLAPFFKKGRKFQELPRYPGTQRDLSVVIPEAVKAQDIREIIQGLGEGLIRRVEIFDLFRGGRIPKGFKNLGFRLTYQSSEKTLISEDIQKLHTGIAEKIVKKFQATFQ